MQQANSLASSNGSAYLQYGSSTSSSSRPMGIEPGRLDKTRRLTASSSSWGASRCTRSCSRRIHSTPLRVPRCKSCSSVCVRRRWAGKILSPGSRSRWRSRLTTS
ncbi:unnamed protein product [Amoebophrya sp. A120]|nr:unnamed protein product [Amoebophrya sp. A120]|eukprot:GSA120T00002486001.1